MVKLLVDKVVIRISSDFAIRTGTYIYNAFIHITINNNELIIAKDIDLTIDDVESILSIVKQPKLSILYLSHDNLINIPRFIYKYRPNNIEINNLSELKLD